MIFKKILIISLLCSSVHLRAAFREANSSSLKQSDELVQAFVNGDAKIIGNHFNSMVELIFSERQGIYARGQAEQMLRNFFTENASSTGKFSFKIVHSSPNRDNVQFYIGELNTGKGSFRVTIYMKAQRIHQLRIESND